MLARREFMKMGILSAGLIQAKGLAAIDNLHGESHGQKPNIIIIQTDDQGHDDIEYHKFAHVLETPHINRMVCESVEFTNFYVSTVCAPTRAAVLTGRHHLKCGVWGVHGGMDFLNKDETTFAEVLKKEGYSTSHFGKWHSGKTDGYFPWDRGFDESYFSELYVYHDNPVNYNGKKIQTKGWIEEYLADRAIDYIEEHKDDSFLMYYCPMTCHLGRYDMDYHGGEDFFAPEGYIQKYKDKGMTDDLSKLYAMIDFLDHQLGRIFDKIEKTGLADNTVIMFLSDNGPLNGMPGKFRFSENEWEHRNPSGMKGQKGYCDENGIRSFMFIRKSGDYGFTPRVEKELTGAVDIFPTVLELAGTEVPKNNKSLDGFSLVPLLENGKWDHNNRYLYTHEVGKDGIWTNMIFELDQNRKVKKPQKWLRFNSKGEWVKIDETNSIRQGGFKLKRGELYYIGGMDGHQEENEIKNKDKKRTLQQELERWWREDIIGSPGSYRKPTFAIGYPGRKESEILAYAPIEKSPNIHVGSHKTTGWKAKDDFIFLKVNVMRDGVYQPEFHYDLNGENNAVIELAVGSYKEIINGDGEVSLIRISPEGSRVSNQLKLKKKPGQKIEMRIRIKSIEKRKELFKEFTKVTLKWSE